MLRVSGPHVDLKRVDVRRLNPLNQLASFITEKSRYEPSQHATTVHRSVEARTAALGETLCSVGDSAQRPLTHHQHWPRHKGAGLH